MTEGLDQLMRLLSARATDWLRHRLEALPNPLPAGDPLTAPLAEALGTARLMSGLMGRPSAAELLLRRHLDQDILRRASLDVLAGRDGPGAAALVVHGPAADPLRRLAAEHMIADPACPLPLRLMLRREGEVVAEAEAALLSPLPRLVTAEVLTARARLLVALWQGGAAPPRLSSRRIAGEMHRALQLQAEMAGQLGATEATAWTGFALGLLGGPEELHARLPPIFARQAADGSFAAGPADLRKQSLTAGLPSTMAVLAALHLAVMRRWRARPAPAEGPRPLHDCLAMAADAVGARAQGAADGWQRLRAAVALSRASGRDWYARLGPPPLVLDRAQAARLAEVTFGDPVATLRLRAACDTRHAALADHGWLRGRTVRLRPLPAQVAERWFAAAERGDDAAFLTGCRQALRHPGTAPSAAAARAARRLAGAAMAEVLDPATDLPAALDALERLILLATVIEGEAPMRMAA